MDGGNQDKQIAADWAPRPLQTNQYLGKQFVEQPCDEDVSHSAESKTDTTTDVDETDLQSTMPATNLYSVNPSEDQWDPSVHKNVQEGEGNRFGNVDVVSDRTKMRCPCYTYKLLFAIAIGLAVLAAIATGLVGAGLATNWRFG